MATRETEQYRIILNEKRQEMRFFCLVIFPFLLII